MKYASHIQLKKFAWGGVVVESDFPAYGSISVVGSIVGGQRVAKEIELAETHAAMLLEGTKKHNKKDIQIILDDLGASLTFSISGDRLVFTGRVPTKNIEKFLSLVSESLRTATFPTTELATLKQRAEGEFDLEARNTRTQASIHLSQLMFIKAHPNWQDKTETSRKALMRITQEKLVQYHSRAIDGSSLILSVAGDIKPHTMWALTVKYFKKLPQIHITLPNVSPLRAMRAKKVTTTIKDKASIDYMLGIATGITKDASEYAALLMGINILGNMRGFSGRLMKTVREEKGLTYGVYSYLTGFNSLADGAVVVWGTFAPALFKKGRTAIKHEIQKIIKNGVTHVEVKKHGEMFAASSKVQLSNSFAFAKAAHDTIVDGHSLSYIDEFPKKILTLTPALINKALRKYLKMKYLSESAAGPVDTI